MTEIAVLSSKGQVTIPKNIRDYFTLVKADKLLFTLINNNTFIVKPLKKSFFDFAGSVKPKKRPEDYNQIRKTVMKKVAQSIIKRTA